MNADGTGVERLTTHRGKDFMPRWSPDGRSILFHSDRGGNEDVYLLQLAAPEASPAG